MQAENFAPALTGATSGSNGTTYSTYSTRTVRTDEGRRTLPKGVDGAFDPRLETEGQVEVSRSGVCLLSDTIPTQLRHNSDTRKRRKLSNKKKPSECVVLRITLVLQISRGNTNNCPIRNSKLLQLCRLIFARNHRVGGVVTSNLIVLDGLQFYSTKIK